MRSLVVGTDKVERALDAISQRAMARARRAMALAVGMVHREAASIVPVLTGRLKNSLFWKINEEGGSLIGRVGTGVEYAPVVEKRKPYLAPALSKNERAIASLFASGGVSLHGQ